MNDDKTFDIDNLPEDASISTGQTKDYAPIDPSEIYQVEIKNISLRENPFYKEDEKDPKKKQSKYQFNFEYVILDEGEYYGRRIWDSTSLSFKPSTQKGPTKLYKIVTKAMKLEMDWEETAQFAPDLKTFMKNLQQDVVGRQIRVAIENTTNPDTKKTKTKITTYNEAKKEMPAFDPDKVQKPEGKTGSENVDPDDIPF